VQRVIDFFNVIWDESEELERLAKVSSPKVSIDAGGLSPFVTEAVNLFAREVSSLSD
jgi:hypothetical protein